MICGSLFPTGIRKYVAARFLCQFSETSGQDLASQLPTQTDIVFYKGFFDARVGIHNEESFFNLSGHERSNDVGYICVPLTPESPFPHRTYGPHFPPGTLLLELGASQHTRPASLPLFDAEQYLHPHPYTVDAQVSVSLLTTSAEVAPEFVPHLNIDDSPTASESFPGMVGLCPHWQINGRPYRRSNQGISASDIKLPNLAIWGPDSPAKHFCILMGTAFTCAKTIVSVG